MSDEKRFLDLPYDDKRSFLFRINEAEQRAYKGELQTAILYFADALRFMDSRLKRIEYVIEELGKIVEADR